MMYKAALRQVFVQVLWLSLPPMLHTQIRFHSALILKYKHVIREYFVKMQCYFGKAQSESKDYMR